VKTAETSEEAICVEEEIKEEETSSQKSKDGDTKRRRKIEQGDPWKFLGCYELRLCPHEHYSQNLLLLPPSQLRCLLAGFSASMLVGGRSPAL
jgi:hypothetical protein